MTASTQFVDVSDVRVLTRYVLEMTFSNGQTRVLDVEPFLWGLAFEPLLASYPTFCLVRADPEAGTIVWPNGADLAPEMLFERSKPAVPA